METADQNGVATEENEEVQAAAQGSKNAFFPKMPKRTKSVNDGAQNFAKLIPALKKRTKRGDSIEEKEDSSEEEDEEDSPSSPVVAAPAQILITVHVPFLRKSGPIKISPTVTVNEAIKVMMTDFEIDSEKYQVTDLKLCKTIKGVTTGDNRVWLDPALNLQTYQLKTGDELKLKSLKERFVLQINKPPSTTIYSFAYDFNTTIKAALLSLLKDSNQMANAERFGLYYPMKGIWLDDSKTLEYYDIDPSHSIDLRQLSQEILLKVVLAETPNKIGLTLKVLRSQTVAEVIAMINKKVTLENTHQCSLFYISKNIWLDNNKTLDDYEVEQHAVLEFKGKFRMLSIIIQTEDDQEQAINLLVDHNATVEDVINVLSMANPTLEEESFSLFYQYGVPVKTSLSIQEISVKETLEYRITPRQIRVSPAYDPSAVQTFDVAFTAPVKTYLPNICRRFGVLFSDFALLQKRDGQPVNVEQSLYQQRISPDSLFVLKTFSQGWVQKQSGDDNVEDPDIWNEPADNDKNIQFETGSNSQKLLCGTLNKLVEKLTDDKTHDLAYVKTFLLTYRSFTTPEIFLKKMIERYHVPRPVNTAYEDFERNIKRPIQLRVCNVIKQWIEKHSSDFLDGGKLAPFAKEILKFIREIVAPDDSKLAKQLLNTVEKLRDGSLTSLKEFGQENPAPPIRIPTKSDPKLFDYHPEEIARQLTLIEFEIFQDIKPPEFLNQNWNRKNSDVKSPNILRISERFNRTVVWVVDSILTKQQIKQRIQRMEFLIEVMSFLHQLNNFSTLMAFVAGFNNAAIQRLKYTRAELSNRSLKRLETLENLMSAEGSYKHYRSVIHRAKPPLVPYIGVYLADLTFIDDGNPNYFENLINFSKRRLDYSVISEIQLYQNEPFNLLEYPELKAKLFDFPDAGEQVEKALYELSLKVEPRGAERSQIE